VAKRATAAQAMTLPAMKRTAARHRVGKSRPLLTLTLCQTPYRA
jgi:hypothetical protein